ncbi:class I SAM-dependent methyltransferase [Bosea sp. CS1GBMeth4]|uniref:class I SAM-dependent methyltransferase n=1 Tax=Bosea sp. CS1GBMeth4 TaxID=1892849 RepID=UPI00164644D3|nr:class I SAM-dependent methyltransferase [Bosea sp. CS1GBMeth4]
MYRFQRHIYDVTRKFYLLGRDGLIAGLQPPPGGAVLEIGCGTGRNLIEIARRYPQARCYGLDISEEMLRTARRQVARAGLSERITLAQADATSFDPLALFGRTGFERVVISYALSMIPPWREALAEALRVVAPGGSLHVVDFGDQAHLPGPFRVVLNHWLALFHVTPREDLEAVVSDLCAGAGALGGTTRLYGGYSVRAVAVRPE